jgi:hypothetical protein
MSRRHGRAGVLVVAFVLLLCSAFALPVRAGEIRGARVVAHRDAPLAPVTGAAAALDQSRPVTGGPLARLPLYFIENRGQVDERVAYYVQGRDKTLYFTPQGVTFALRGAAPDVMLSRAKHLDTFGGEEIPFRVASPLSLDKDERSPLAANGGLTQGRPRSARNDTSGAAERWPDEAVQLRWIVKLLFLGANPDVRPVGVDETGAVISYFKGRREEWVTGGKAYSGVVYRDLWPGIDLEYYGLVDKLKYQFVVRPGADPSQIRLAYHGATHVTVDEAGSMQVSTPLGGFEDGAPYAYQRAEGGEKVPVEVSYDFLSSSHEYSFRLGDYDRTEPLILDPTVLNYCGYLGGLGDDEAKGIAVDSSGNAYVTGFTDSSHTTFPVTVGPDQTFNGGDADAFVAKVRADGSGLEYCGYIGGSDSDQGLGVAVDSLGYAYIAGRTHSDETQGFPAAIGPHLLHSGTSDAFVAKVRADGADLVYCGYIGGAHGDYGYAIAVDGSGSAYVAGQTFCAPADGFPVLVGPDLTYAGGGDAFVAKVSAAGTGLVYCGYIGGGDSEDAIGIAVDSLGSAYVAGSTDSYPAAGFPVTVGPDVTYNGNHDAYVAKVGADGAGLDYCGYIGGGGDDFGYGVAVDSSGNAYVTGNAMSGQATFPVTVGPDLTYGGGEFGDGFVAKVRSDGAQLEYCGYIGGLDSERGEAIAVDGEGNAYLAGLTWSSEARDFPVILGPDVTFNGGMYDAFVAKVISDGTQLDYCGYIGGLDNESGEGIALDGEGNAYVAGTTRSSQAQGFPVTMGPDVSFNGGSKDAFVARVGENRAPTLGTVTPSSGSSKTGVTVYITTTWKDADGRQDLKQCYFHIGATPSLPGNVTLMYNARKDKLWMLSDDGATWLGGYAPGSLVPIENSQARLHVSDTKVTGVNDTVQVGWALEFKKDYIGSKKTGLKCKDAHKAKAKGKWKGTWLIY